MKAFKNLLGTISFISLFMLVMSCEQKISVDSVVHPDGAIDRTIAFREVDSAKIVNNIFGITQGKGWERTIEVYEDEPDSENADSLGQIATDTNTENNPTKKGQKLNIIFKKHFSSPEESNQDLNNANDSLFHISSTFEKKFRWFYTYIEYSDTYAAVNRYKSVPLTEVFSPEDFTFINRLPGEGKKITRADSIYLDLLEEKIYEKYLVQSAFDENFDLMLKAVKDSNIASHWADTLLKYRFQFFSDLLKADDDDILDKPFMINLIDRKLERFPLEKVESSYRALHAATLPRIRFMFEVGGQAKFTHSIKMPWKVIETNADSISDGILHWHPPLLKFLLTDYTMHAKVRKMNYWAVALSIGLIIITVVAFVRRKG